MKKLFILILTHNSYFSVKRLLGIPRDDIRIDLKFIFGEMDMSYNDARDQTGIKDGATIFVIQKYDLKRIGYT